MHSRITYLVVLLLTLISFLFDSDAITYFTQLSHRHIPPHFVCIQEVQAYSYFFSFGNGYIYIYITVERSFYDI